MTDYRASKTQIRALAALGIQHAPYISYGAAGDLLEQAGWSRDGRGEAVQSDCGSHYSSYSEYQ